MIYFDNAATTKPFKTALQKALKFNDTEFFNPSALYSKGIDIKNTIKDAKQVILKSLGLSETLYEVIFTSCGTESDNTAIFGAVKRGVFVTDKGEHSAVTKCFNELKQRGQIVWFCPLNSDGSVNTQELFSYIKAESVDFVSIMHVNNETGAINDINSIASDIKKINPKTIFHSDGVQAFGKLPFKLTENIDLYSISAHKINALKGTGALVKRKKINLSPLLFGGGQENGLRSGTENVFGIKVFEYAAKEHYDNIEENYNKVYIIKNYIKENLDRNLFKVISGSNASPYILSVSAIGVKGEILMHMLEKVGFVVGNGSACSSKNKYSRIIEACGFSHEVLDGVIRISFSIENTIDEAVDFVKNANEIANNLKRMMN